MWAGMIQVVYRIVERKQDTINETPDSPPRAVKRRAPAQTPAVAGQ